MRRGTGSVQRETQSVRGMVETMEAAVRQEGVVTSFVDAPSPSPCDGHAAVAVGGGVELRPCVSCCP